MAFDSFKADMKAVGSAIKHSPKAMRKKLGMDSGNPVKKLDEDWYHSDDPINTGVNFYVKYLGSTEVAKTHGAGSTDDAVRKIVHHAKARGSKLQKVQMTISSRSVKLLDMQQNMKLEDIPLYRVSYCTVDPYYDKVFCYISRNHETKTLECHAFLCSKKSKAEAITLTVAQAFNIAFERWQANKKKKRASKDTSTDQQSANGAVQKSTEAPADSVDGSIALGVELTTPQKEPAHQTTPTPPKQATPTPPSIQLLPPQQQQHRRELSPLHSATKATGDMSIGVTPASPKGKTDLNPFAADDSAVSKSSPGLLDIKPTITKAISLDHLAIDDQFDREFTVLAECRSNPHLLAIGEHMDRTDMHDDVMHMMRGESNPDDLAKTKSIDDLLLL